MNALNTLHHISEHASENQMFGKLLENVYSMVERVDHFSYIFVLKVVLAVRKCHCLNLEESSFFPPSS